ncbi:hypothetical protein MTR67_008687 [Solanum verrucosum]|uniref:PGG domain-containing protein n=1 Tax=Solanum verrucosum TaxID=315347 RepID=A0AAF0Q2N7_SOLVR|nr:hypothetical protein MTR67_008687 [Solanum verrucosum]
MQRKLEEIQWSLIILLHYGENLLITRERYVQKKLALEKLWTGSVKEGERWMKDTANSCMLVATLIATMVFAAGFTVPGGYNSDNGIPILLKLYGFRIFVISDAVALFSSIVSIIMFLSILTSRYAEDDFLVSLPTKLLFGHTMLFVSIFSMFLAFAATFFLVYSNHMGWEPKLIAACAGVPLALFGCLQYKLWFDLDILVQVSF